MQRDPFIWMRGTPVVYWRDISDAGEARTPTAFGDAASSRVLLVADPHPENIGSFRASDGTMFIDWNDFDSSGYGPYEGDVRRLAAGLIVASHDAAEPETAPAEVDPAFADAVARAAAAGYAAQIHALAMGQAALPVTTGAAKYLDKLLAKALANGDAGKDLADVSEVVDGTRVFLTGDLDPVADDGVIEGAVDVDRIRSSARGWSRPRAVPRAASRARHAGRARARLRLGRVELSGAALPRAGRRRIGSSRSRKSAMA